MNDRYKDRLKILEDEEIEELYGRPQFNHEERTHFFSLSPEERTLADGHYILTNCVLFILQVGYFKARTLFFAFDFDEVQADVRHILDHHYADSGEAAISGPVVKQTRHAQQKKILQLYDSRACGSRERAGLMARAAQVVRLSAKPVFLFRSLLQHLESLRIVVPGYSFMQDVVSQALAAERSRLTALLAGGLDTTTAEALDDLYMGQDGYAITPLKHDPKDFSLRETKLEIARSQSLDALYQTAKAILPKLGISNDSVAYYAALVDYYTVQKLQQLPSGMARLYILCFLSQRYRQINDNLVNGLIHQVRKGKRRGQGVH